MIRADSPPFWTFAHFRDILLLNASPSQYMHFYFSAMLYGIVRGSQTTPAIANRPLAKFYPIFLCNKKLTNLEDDLEYENEPHKEDSLKNEDNPNKKDKFKKEDDLKNEDNLKSEDNIYNEDDLENEDNAKMKTN